MHNSEDGASMGVLVSPWLIKGSDPSSICLNCHSGAGGTYQSTVSSHDGSALTPGGDFYWLTKNFSWTGGNSPGERHGHNIIAADFGFVQDSFYIQSPGGTYQSVYLSCTSCHDPHGKVNSGSAVTGRPISGSGSYGTNPDFGSIRGNYRLLGDASYSGGSHIQGFSFSYPAPIAAQNPLAPYAETDNSHVDYGSGMSEWCANCHAGYLINEHSAFQHPAGNNAKLEAAMVQNYITYIKTGDLSGNTATAYLQFAPFERGTTDPSQLNPKSSQGPDTNSNVMCLTCHRAHASAFRAIGRWDFDATFLADSHPANGDVGVTGNDVLFSYYNRGIADEFGTGQLAFCEKCHDVSGP